MNTATAALRYGSITDVPGVAVGHAQRVGDGWLSGVTVVLPPPATVGAVEVRGGGPGTHETDALDPTTLVPTVDAVCLTGGSAYGLAAAGGVQQWCEENGLGFPVGPPPDRRRVVVPIVPAAAVFDLGRGGDPRARPDAALGHAAADAAGRARRTGPNGEPNTGPDPKPNTGPDPKPGPDGRTPVPPRGVIGAGTGALMAGGRLKGGVGTASIRLPGGFVVGALAVVNAAGSPADPVTGALLATAFDPPGLARPLSPAPEHALALAEHLTGPDPHPVSPTAAVGPAPGTATTLAVVATDAVLDPAQARRMAVAAHDGLARSINPVHTLLDGDTVFTLATGRLPVPGELVGRLHAAAADAVLLAVLDAVLEATATTTSAIDVPAYLDLCPPGIIDRPS